MHLKRHYKLKARHIQAHIYLHFVHFSLKKKFYTIEFTHVQGILNNKQQKQTNHHVVINFLKSTL